MAAKVGAALSPADNALATLKQVRVLLAEDERRVADAVARGLRRAGMAVDVAYDGAAALDKARLNGYDVVVLDRDLPAVHGDEVCRTLRGEEPDSRVLMLTAAATLDDLVDGLSLGADDYLPKPFAFAELVARVRALGRRTGRAAGPTLTAGDLELDPARRTVTRTGHPIDLTPKEFALLEALMQADGAVLSNDELVGRVWDENADPFTKTVQVTIGRLRRKLGEPDVIETTPGVGYRIQSVTARQAKP
jgi:two-component system, OmpR family, response regulator VanR